MNLSRQNLIKSLILVCFAFLLYTNSFHVPFQFDDSVVIVENKAVHLLPDWPATFQAVFHFQASRFLTLLTFAVNYYLHGLNVVGYHVVNVAVHLGAAFAVWWLGELLAALSRIPEKKAGRKKDKTADSGWRMHVPFAAALLFLAHPVNTEAVTYITQRGEALAALFYIVSVCFYIKGRMGAKTRAATAFTAAAVCGLLAMLSKETAISLPITILSVEIFFFRREKPSSKIIGLVLLGLLIVPALFRFEWGIITQPHASQSHLGDVLMLPTYIWTELKVFVVYLRLLFVPIGLNLDYDFAVSSLFDPATLASLALLAALAWSAFRWRVRYPMLSWAVFWFFLSLSSNLVPRNHVIFEHKLYLAAAGVIPALYLGLYDAVQNRKALAIVMSAVLVVFSGLTIARNTVWQSQVSLWQDVIKKSPGKGRAYLSLGAAYGGEGKYDLALANLIKASTLMSDAKVYTTRGHVYVLKKDDDRALQDFNKAIVLNPQYLDAYLGRGEVLARRKEYAAAAVDFNKAIEINPENPGGFKMRGRLNENFRRYEAALEDYNRALRLDPGDAQTVAWRGYVNASLGHKDQAMHDFEEALRLDPSFSDGYVYHGMLRKDERRMNEALNDFNKAVTLKPSALAYYQRADFWFRKRDYSAAMNDVNRAIEMDPNYDLAYGLRARLFVEDKQLRRAVADLDRSLEINPNYIEGFLNRGLLRQKIGDTDGAVADLTKAITLGPNAAAPYVRRARLYATLKKYDEALSDLLKVIQMDPANGANYFNRSVIYKEKGDLKKALDDAREAQQKGFNVPDDYLKQLGAP